jgi:hypothetical protein
MRQACAVARFTGVHGDALERWSGSKIGAASSHLVRVTVQQQRPECSARNGEKRCRALDRSNHPPNSNAVARSTATREQREAQPGHQQAGCGCGQILDGERRIRDRHLHGFPGHQHHRGQGQTNTMPRRSRSSLTASAGLPSSHHISHRNGRANAALKLGQASSSQPALPPCRLSARRRDWPALSATSPAMASRPQRVSCFIDLIRRGSRRAWPGSLPVARPDP